MEYVKLGNTGLDVSKICLGCMSFGDSDVWLLEDWQDPGRKVQKDLKLIRSPNKNMGLLRLLIKK